MKAKKRFGILVGGGPAPGINGVISAAVIEAFNSGYATTGILDGFKWIMRGDIRHTRPLHIPEVSRIHLTGGSILHTSRANPLTAPGGMAKTIKSLGRLGITHLITIGGDGTAALSAHLAQEARGAFKTVHVPKTIDNDLPLPQGASTFGFQTARHVGTMIVQNLMEDAKTTHRWYVVVTMGRGAGLLALGICFAAGATLAVLPEELSSQPHDTLKQTCDIVEGAVIKRKFLGRDYGVAILAEGLARSFAEEKHLNQIPLRLSDINFGQAVREELQSRLSTKKQRTEIIAKDIGYELRSCDPIPFDVDYTRRLGYAAVRQLLAGQDQIMVCYTGGILRPIPFALLLDPATGRTRTRRVDLDSEYYKAALSYMIRLKLEDFKDKSTLKGLAQAGGMSVNQFRSRFQYLCPAEPKI